MFRSFQMAPNLRKILNSKKIIIKKTHILLSHQVDIVQDEVNSLFVLGLVSFYFFIISSSLYYSIDDVISPRKGGSAL